MGGKGLSKVAGHVKVNSDSPGVGCAGWASPSPGDPKQPLTRTFTLEESLTMMLSIRSYSNASHAGIGRIVHTYCSCEDSDHQTPALEGHPSFCWKVRGKSSIHLC